MDQMDTGLELSAEEQRAISAHRTYYNDYLKAARKERESTRTGKRKLPSPGVEEFDLGLDLGLDPYAGLTPPCFELPKEREGLWLSQPYAEGGEGAGGLTMFDQTRLFPKKCKAKPETPDEVRDCKQPLTPKELLMVAAGPKTIDFGTISVFTTVARNFTVMNDLRSSVLVSIEVGGEDELQGSTPPTQVALRLQLKTAPAHCCPAFRAAARTQDCASALLPCAPRTSHHPLLILGPIPADTGDPAWRLGWFRHRLHFRRAVLLPPHRQIHHQWRPRLQVHSDGRGGADRSPPPNRGARLPLPRRFYRYVRFAAHHATQLGHAPGRLQVCAP